MELCNFFCWLGSSYSSQAIWGECRRHGSYVGGAPQPPRGNAVIFFFTFCSDLGGVPPTQILPESFQNLSNMKGKSIPKSSEMMVWGCLGGSGGTVEKHAKNHPMGAKITKSEARGLQAPAPGTRSKKSLIFTSSGGALGRHLGSLLAPFLDRFAYICGLCFD